MYVDVYLIPIEYASLLEVFRFMFNFLALAVGFRCSLITISTTELRFFLNSSPKSSKITVVFDNIFLFCLPICFYIGLRRRFSFN